MKDLQTSIQWADFTWNFWRGCIKVDDDCKFCYMYRDMERYGKKGRDIVPISASTIKKKIKAAKELAAKRLDDGDPTPVRVFVSSWTDVFLTEVDRSWREEIWRIARENPEVILMILTKRPENIPSMLPADWGEGYPNVWLGTSVGSSTPEKRKRIRDLQRVKAKVLFLSLEPLTGPINLVNLYREEDGYTWVDNCLTGFFAHGAGGWYGRKIDWVIVGGESGNETGTYQYRPCELEWIQHIVAQCQIHNVPVYVKQMGTHLAKKMKLKDRHGGGPLEWPEDLQITEHPEF